MLKKIWRTFSQTIRAGIKTIASLTFAAAVFLVFAFLLVRSKVQIWTENGYINISGGSENLSEQEITGDNSLTHVDLNTYRAELVSADSEASKKSPQHFRAELEQLEENSDQEKVSIDVDPDGYVLVYDPNNLVYFRASNLGMVYELDNGYAYVLGFAEEGNQVTEIGTTNGRRHSRRV